MGRSAIDWESVEMQYRAGIRSLKDIGSEFGVSDAGILKRAKRDGWTRDLSAKIQAKAAAKVSASVVSAEVSALTKITEAQVIESNANAVANVQITQRKDILRYRNLVIVMLSELEQTTGNNDLFEQLGEMMISPDKNGKDRLNEIYQKVISIPGRVDSMKKLAETLKILIGLEREAYGIGEDKKQVDESIRDFLKSCRGKSLPVV